MATNKRLQHLEDYKTVLPYASEIFGVYQPLIGWKSARKINRVKAAIRSEKAGLLSRLGQDLVCTAAIAFDHECVMTAPALKPAVPAGPRLRTHASIVVRRIQSELMRLGIVPGTEAEWAQFINDEALTNVLQSSVVDYYRRLSIDKCHYIAQLPKRARENDHEFQLRTAHLVEDSQRDIRAAVNDEAVVAGVLKRLLDSHRIRDLASIFFELDARTAFADALAKASVDFEDPYLTFDPHKNVKDVSLSPLGIVHLFRQYFFELDTFLGTPIGHVWLSPGSTLELIEVNTRKTLTEKVIELALETTAKSEKSTTEQDELSEAVKQDNKDDLKLGATATVNQSWGTGNASATASLNMDRTQQVARETTHKRMREQTEKLSSEIRQNFKSTFRTVTEVTDTSSKRYTFTNTTGALINYELRRKMRQTGVQVQDIGSYLCWETFVDEPGVALGLANLVHIAQPADLLPVPAEVTPVYPPDRVKTFRANATWNPGVVESPGFLELTAVEPPPADEGFELVAPAGDIELALISVTGEEIEEFSEVRSKFDFAAKFWPDRMMVGIGLNIPVDGLSWDDRLDFVLGGALRYRLTDAKKVEIDAAAKVKSLAGDTATAENERKTKEAFIKAVKERVELATGITARRFEDLRDEERIVVYRRLIASLMTSYNYQYADDRSRHILAELLNSIFDVDKMLYFVAPEWWKPRMQAKQFLSINHLQSLLDESVVTWADSVPRPDNYLITDKSSPAPLGSSLGWLLQLDGDSLRNAFLNAPWVKAVIPVRPGKEQAATSWLQNVMVEGADGLDATYAADPAELAQIRQGLTAHGIVVGANVTLRDALEYLCIEVAGKHAASNDTKKFPDTELNDDNKVTATPIEKVFEHGFYPLQGGFRLDPGDPNPDPNNKDRYFQVFDQWIEVLPTDQVVPVEVEYDAKTGRQI
jgi:hypothetical protein